MLKCLIIAMILASVILVDLAEAAENKVEVTRSAYLIAQQHVVDEFAKPEINTNGRRNFMRFLAKMEYSFAKLDNASANYHLALRPFYKKNPDYSDVDYQENKDLKEVTEQ